jgi:hypothetical protein
VLIAAAYFVTVALRLQRLVHSLFWNSDVAAPLVLAERLRGAGDVVIPHYGLWTSMWWLLATRHLPGHRAVWELTGWLSALLAVGLLGWATARVAGRWAGVTAAATALMVGPFALRWLLTTTFHIWTPLTAAVLGTYLVALHERRSVVLAVAVGLLVGANAASDPLLWVAGVVPFAVGTAVLAVITRKRGVALRGGLVIVVAGLAAFATSEVMYSLGYHVVSPDHRLAKLADLPGHITFLARMVALLGGANYALPGGYPVDPLRPFVVLLVLSAILLTVYAAIVMLARRRTQPVLCCFACYWAAVVVVLGLAFIGTRNADDLGPVSLTYLLTLALAAGAGVALFAFRSPRRQLAVAVAVSVVGITNLTGIAHGRADQPGPEVRAYKPQLISLLTRERVTSGYAGYWDAQSLAWQSEMRLMIAPVWQCAKRHLCPYRLFTIDSWFQAKPGPSFLIVDPTVGLNSAPPQLVKQAAEVHKFGPLTVYIFNYDLARHFLRPPGHHHTAERKPSVGRVPPGRAKTCV